MDAARDQLHARYASLEDTVMREIDVLARAGFSDKRWCAIAKTQIEQGFMALQRAIRDYPGDNPNEYGKSPFEQPMPEGFRPNVEPHPFSHDQKREIEWQDARPPKTDKN